MQVLMIAGMTIVAAILFGVLHDQVTVRVCLEYFTIGHQPIFGGLKSPTLLALAWGVVATWWAGAYVGVPLALLARIGRWPKVGARDLMGPLAVLFLVMGLSAVVSGMVGWHRASTDPLLLLQAPRSVPEGQRVAFIADWFAHSASYAVGFTGGIVLWLYVVIRRAHAAWRGCPATRCS